MRNSFYIFRYFHAGMQDFSTQHVKSNLLKEFNQIVPPLNYEFHKGQAGRVGVIGGSEEQVLNFMM